MSESRTTNRNFKQIVNTFYNEEINQIDQEESSNQKKEGNIKIEPKILYDKFLGNMKVEFKIGNEKMYKIKIPKTNLLIIPKIFTYWAGTK